MNVPTKNTVSGNVPRRIFPGLSGLAVLGVGLALTVGGYFWISDVVEQGEKAAFDAESSALVESVRDLLDDNLQAVQSLGALFDASELVSRREFTTFANQEIARLGEIQALSWNPVVTQSRLEDVRRLARRENLTGYQFYERDPEGNKKVPLGERANYVPVLYIEPLETNRAALGFDVGSNAIRRSAFEKARDTGLPVASAIIRLVQGSAEDPSLLVFRPVYINGTVPRSVATRRQALKGFAVGVIRLTTLVTRALEDRGAELPLIEIHDITEGRESARRIFRNQPGEAPGAGQLVYQAPIEFAARVWRVTLHQRTSETGVIQRNAALAYTVGVLAITFLAFGSLVSANRREAVIGRQVQLRSEELAQEVTRSQAIQNELAASESRYRALFDSAPVGIIISYNDNIDRVNAAAAAMLGENDTAVFVGRSPYDLLPEASRDIARERIAAMSPGQEIEPFEADLLRSDGQSFRALAAIALVEFDGQAIVIRTFRDISAEFAAREALRESEAKYRSLIDLFPDSVVLTQNSVITQVNSAGVRVHRANDEFDLIGLDWIELVDESFHDKVYERRELMSQGNLAEATDFLMKRLDGTTYWAESRAVQVTVGGKKMFMTVSKDVTQAREAAHALSTSEENYRQLTELSPEAVTVQGLDTVLFGNEAAALLYGFASVDELIGRDVMNLFSDEQRGRFRKVRERVLTGGEPVVGGTESFINAKGETKSVITAIASVEWNGEPACLVVNQDVSSIRKAQEALEAANAELKRSNEDLAQFAYVASHDLKEPLRMVSSYCQLISQRYADKLDDQGKEFVHYAVDGALRMGVLIDDLLIYSRIGREGHRHELIDLHDVVGEVLEMLSTSIEEAGAEISVTELPTVDGHRSAMIRLFQNLIGNAVKFRSDRPLKIEIGAQFEEENVKIRISDNGIGIPEQFLDQVFGVFKRLHGRSQFDGTGIGLAICEKIVEQMGGSIRAESEEGQGTTIVVTLPVSGSARR